MRWSSPFVEIELVDIKSRQYPARYLIA